MLPHLDGPSAHHDPHARRHRRRALLSEALGAGAAGVRRDGDRVLRDTRTSGTATCWPTTCRRCCGWARSARWSFTSGTRARSSRPRRPAPVPTTPARCAALEASILNYPDYLVFDIDPYIYSGKEAKGAEPELNKRGFAVGQARGVLAARAARRDVARGDREDFGQDRPARVRADRAHRDLRRGAAASARRWAVTSCAPTRRRSPWTGRWRSAPARSSLTTT